MSKPKTKDGTKPRTGRPSQKTEDTEKILSTARQWLAGKRDPSPSALAIELKTKACIISTTMNRYLKPKEKLRIAALRDRLGRPGRRCKGHKKTNE